MKWKQLSRRALLQGSGTCLALPLLEAMFPARQALAQAISSPLRFMVVNWQYGCYENSLNPSGSGANYNFSAHQSALQPYRAHMTPIRLLQNYWAGDMDGAGDHARGQGTYLTCVRLNPSRTNIRNSISADQVVANAIGNQTRVKSAFFSGENSYYEDNAYSSVYKNLSWINATTPNSRLGEPHQMFDALLAGQGGGTPNNQATILRLKKKKSILDGAVADSQRLLGVLGATDRQKVDQFLTSVRDVETRIARDLTSTPTGPTCSPGTRPSQGLNFPNKTRLFFDLMVLAAQCDSTRTFVYHMGSPNDFGPINGVSGHHHDDYSHHKDNPSAIQGLQRIAGWYADQFAYFMSKMTTIQDVDGRPLIYNSIVTYGAEMRDTNKHDDFDIPTLVAGNAGGKFTPGRLLVPSSNIPMANLWLTIMKTMGVNINSFGEGPGASTGTIAL